MRSAEYKGLKIRLFESYPEYEQVDEIVSHYVDAQGNPVEVNPENINYAGMQDKEHFADDSTYKPHAFLWEAITEECDIKGIVCIITDNSATSIDFLEIITTVGHELGHLTDASKFVNSTAHYDTPEGYEQEETKAQTFEAFTLDVYNITMLYLSMFGELGIKVAKDQLLSA